MSKRGAAVQITKDNYDRDDEDRYGPPIIPGTWQSADEETLKKRVIRKAKRPTPSANGSLPLPPANPFGSLELSAGSAPAGEAANPFANVQLVAAAAPAAAAANPFASVVLPTANPFASVPSKVRKTDATAFVPLASNPFASVPVASAATTAASASSQEKSETDAAKGLRAEEGESAAESGLSDLPLSSRAGRPLACETKHGIVEGLLFGTVAPGAENVVLCISGKSPNLDVVTEWHKTAQALAAAGFAVILPDLHTNDKTKPGVIAVSDALELMCALLDMQGVSATTPAVVMGKSWGGGIATRFAAQHPARVSKLVLVAPSLAPSLDERRTVVASLAQSLFIRLMWAEDDTVVPVDRADAYKEGLDDTRLTFTTTTAGGHRVLDEYVEQVVTWIRK